MQSSPPPADMIRRLQWLLFAVVLLSGAWFYNGASWNHNSRLDVIFAFVEPGSRDFLSFRIDRFITDPELGENTGDWANNPQFDRHYYSNKAPGVALAAIPVYTILYWAERAAGIDPTEVIPSFVNAYLINLAVSVLPLALAIPLFFRLLLGLGRPLDESLIMAVGLGLGTLLFPYSTQLWGHTTAASCLVFALFALRQANRNALAICGLWSGMSVLMEYSCAISVGLIGVYILCTCQRRQILWYMLGGLLPLLVYGAYHTLCFGAPWTTANFHNNPIFHETGDVLGVFGALSGEALWGLTFSRYRGLFWYMPALLPALAAACRLRWRREDSMGWLCVANAAGYLLLNMTFNGWHGGASIGPRYLIPALPFLALLAAHVPWRGLWRAAVCALVAVSVVNMAVIASLTVTVPVEARDPLTKSYLVLLRHGLIKPYAYCPLRNTTPPREVVAFWGKFNLGEWLGLSGWFTIMPWLVLAGTCFWLMYEVRRKGTEQPPRQSATQG